MSHPARDPRSGIDGKANAAGGRHPDGDLTDAPAEAERMSHPARDPRSRWRIRFDQSGKQGVGTVRPSRSRTPPKSESGEKARKLPPASRQKAPTPRKAPSRGRYIDEYARPF
jgi:hypothetical protein